MGDVVDPLSCLQKAGQRVLSANLEGTFNMCQTFARTLKAAKAPGVIVNVSSGAGITAVPNRLGYVASKSGVSGITRAMAVDLGPFGIRVNAVAPGMIRTPMTEVMFRDPEDVKWIRAAHLAPPNAFALSCTTKRWPAALEQPRPLPERCHRS